MGQCNIVIRLNLDRTECYATSEAGARGPISNPTPYIEWRCFLPFAHGGRHESQHSTPLIVWNS